MLSGSDMEMALRYQIPITASYEEGSLLFPVAQLAGILRETPDRDIKIESIGRTAQISGKNVLYKLPCFPEEGFPEIPELEGEKVVLNKADLVRLLRDVSFSMDKDKTRFGLDSLLLCLTGEMMEGVATDQIRLAYTRYPMKTGTKQEEKYFFPARAIPVLLALLGDDEEETVTMVKGGNQVVFRFKNGFFITRLMDAQFPKYREAYNQYKDCPGLEINTEEMGTAIRQIMLLTCENAKNIAMLVEKDKVVLKASTQIGEGKVELPVLYNGEEMAVGMNPYFVLDFLKEVGERGIEKVFMKVSGQKKPIILYTSENYLYFMSPTSNI